MFIPRPLTQEQQSKHDEIEHLYNILISLPEDAPAHEKAQATFDIGAFIFGEW